MAFYWILPIFIKYPPPLFFPDLFPAPDSADENGIVAVGGELALPLLLDAYQQGIFPWPHPDCPLLWFSPDPRCVLFPDKFHISRRSERKIRNSGFRITINTAFPAVIEACASLHEANKGTWISPQIIASYTKLHRAGFAQSVEVWANGGLVGGLYGVCMGQAFFGESMFHIVPEASRAALQALVEEARRLGFLFIDCQQDTPHMLAMGAELVPRQEFLELLGKALR